MNPFRDLLSTRPDGGALQDLLNRRLFLGRGASALGSAALAGLLGQRSEAASASKAKRVIYLFQSGAPSQMDLFRSEAADGGAAGQGSARHRSAGAAAHDDDLGAEEFPRGAVDVQVREHGESGTWISELMPNISAWPMSSASSARCSPRRSITIPAITFCQTGSPARRRPSIGSWLSYGLGTDNPICPPTSCSPPSAPGARTTSRSTTASGQRLFAHAASGREVPQHRAIPCSISPIPPG
jgi:hypothetical protein